MTLLKKYFLEIILLINGIVNTLEQQGDDKGYSLPEQTDWEAASCPFNSSFCSYTQLPPSGDANNWTISNGHATVQSGLENFGATSIIQSPRLTSDLPACLAYLYTQSMPSQLTVRVTDGVGGYCVLIKESNRQVDEFTEQKIDLPQANGRIAFVAKSGANAHDGNITLKNVKLTSGPCAGAHANTSTPGPTQPPECVNFTIATTTTTATTKTTATTTATTTTTTTTGTRTSTASTTTTATSPTAHSTGSTTAAVSPTASYKGHAKDSSRNTTVIIACVIVLLILIIIIVGGVLFWWKTKNRHKRDVHPLEDKQAADPPGLEPAINNPPHSHFMVTDTGQRWADKSSTDVTSTDELVANEQPTDTTGNVSPNGHDQDQIVDIDETLDFDYDTNDDPYDFEYMNTAPFSGLLNR